MLIPDLTWMQDTALSLASVAAVLSLATVVLGLFSVITGKDHFPLRFRRLLGRVPASVEDHRLHGTRMMLNGAALMLAELGATAGIFGGRGIAGFPNDVLFFMTMLTFLTAFACTIGSYSVGIRVRLVSTRASTDAQPGVPPA
jgi:hypothetical protein